VLLLETETRRRSDPGYFGSLIFFRSNSDTWIGIAESKGSPSKFFGITTFDLSYCLVDRILGVILQYPLRL